MKEEIISFETAKLAKEMGINLNDIGIDGYDKDGNKCHGFYSHCIQVYPAPTQSLLQKWLREKYNAHIIIAPGLLNKGKYYCEIECPNNRYFMGRNHNTYEEALEVGLKETLKLIKDEKISKDN
jgi:hypothetical protein